jgi:hypothetical protein
MTCPDPGHHRLRWLVLAAAIPLVALLPACSSSSLKSAATIATTNVASSVPSTGPASPPSVAAATSATTAAQACLFGDWGVTAPKDYSGSSWDIRTDGSIVVDYTGVLDGEATFNTTLPANPQGTSGNYLATPTSQNVTAASQRVTLTAHDTTWTCHGNSLTLVVSPGGTFQLSRKGS